jgi:hypothetical protein
MLSNSSNYFKKILNRLNLENVVFEATHFTTETGTWIDLCITNRKKLVNSVDVLTPVYSTHAPILAEISFKTFKQHSFQRQIRNYNAVDIEGLFADDTSLFVVVENDHAAAATSLTDDLNVISNWAKGTTI